MEVWIFLVGEVYEASPEDEVFITEGTRVEGVFITESAARKAMIAKAQADLDSWGTPDDTLGSFDPETVTRLEFGYNYYIIQSHAVQEG